MYTKDLERLVRSLAAQRLDPEYIRHYLIETYQLTPKIVDEVFTTVGVNKDKSKPTGNNSGNPGISEKPKRREFT